MSNPACAMRNPQTDAFEFKLNPRLDVAALTRRFSSSARLQIDHFLTTESALGLRDYLEWSEDWRHIFNMEDQTI